MRVDINMGYNEPCCTVDYATGLWVTLGSGRGVVVVTFHFFLVQLGLCLCVHNPVFLSIIMLACWPVSVFCRDGSGPYYFYCVGHDTKSPPPPPLHLSLLSVGNKTLNFQKRRMHMITMQPLQARPYNKILFKLMNSV